MTYFAHSGTPGDKSDWQPLAGHLQAVAQLAATFARPFGMEKAATVLGLFHDLGKYNPAFQPRLEGADIRVDHSTAGAKVLVELARESMREGRARAEDVFMAEMLARTGVDRNRRPDFHGAQRDGSPATRGRGSKLELGRSSFLCRRRTGEVARCARAWIETAAPWSPGPRSRSSPACARAWIETPSAAAV